MIIRIWWDFIYMVKDGNFWLINKKEIQNYLVDQFSKLYETRFFIPFIDLQRLVESAIIEEENDSPM